MALNVDAAAVALNNLGGFEAFNLYLEDGKETPHERGEEGTEADCLGEMLFGNGWQVHNSLSPRRARSPCPHGYARTVLSRRALSAPPRRQSRRGAASFRPWARLQWATSMCAW